MYDFSLVLMVAQNSQKDPREYLPFLSELSRMELNMQKYTIDSFLGKHDKALEWLACSNDAVFSSCLAYTIKYVLYKTAMGIFKDSKYEYNQVLIAYGEYAVSKAEYQEAAIRIS